MRSLVSVGAEGRLRVGQHDGRVPLLERDHGRMDRHQGRTGTARAAQAHAGTRAGTDTGTGCSAKTVPRSVGGTVGVSAALSFSVAALSTAVCIHFLCAAPAAAATSPVAAPKPAVGGGGDLMSAIAAGRGGLRKTSIIGSTDSPKSGGSNVTSPVKTFSPPAAKVASPTNAGNTQPAAALRTFGAPKPAAAAATSPTAAVTPVKATAAPVKAAAPAPAPAPKKDEGWQELMTPEGIPYYHNKITNGRCWTASACVTGGRFCGHCFTFPRFSHLLRVCVTVALVELFSLFPVTSSVRAAAHRTARRRPCDRARSRSGARRVCIFFCFCAPITLHSFYFLFSSSFFNTLYSCCSAAVCLCTRLRNSWDKPECLKTDADKERAGEWVWCPDAVEAFVPAKKLETFYDGRVEVEKEDGTRVTLAKNVVLEELTWSSLRRPVRDLVMLDVMNQPLILHNLKDRFAQNEIYVRCRRRGDMSISALRFASLRHGTRAVPQLTCCHRSVLTLARALCQTNVGTILISMNPYKVSLANQRPANATRDLGLAWPALLPPFLSCAALRCAFST